MQILYRPLVTLHLWHDYVLGQAGEPDAVPTADSGLRLVPTADCARVLRNLRWVARPTLEGLVIFAEADPIAPGSPDSAYRTKLPIARPARLTFWLEVRDRAFANFTNLPLTGDRGHIYYFSNRSGNAQTYTVDAEGGGTREVTVLFLSQPLPTYTPGAEYPLGQLVTTDTATLEALTHQSAAAANPAAADWETLPPSQYVSGQDRWPYQGMGRTVAIAAANPGDTFTATLTDITNQRPFAQPFTVPESHLPGDPLTLAFTFAGQSPGRYQLAIAGTPINETVILHAPQAAPQAWGLVELAIAADPADPFAPLQPSGDDTLIQPRTYVLRFKNRTTHWRYRTQTAHGLSDADLTPQGLTRVDDRTYITTRPRGLRQRPNPPPLNNTRQPLPFPNAAHLHPAIDADQRITHMFSDIYL